MLVKKLNEAIIGNNLCIKSGVYIFLFEPPAPPHTETLYMRQDLIFPC